jgi:hypothetical protein
MPPNSVGALTHDVRDVVVFAPTGDVKSVWEGESLEFRPRPSDVLIDTLINRMSMALLPYSHHWATLVSLPDFDWLSARGARNGRVGYVPIDQPHHEKITGECQ